MLKETVENDEYEIICGRYDLNQSAITKFIQLVKINRVSKVLLNMISHFSILFKFCKTSKPTPGTKKSITIVMYPSFKLKKGFC